MKTVNFSETIVASDLKVSRSRHLIEYMTSTFPENLKRAQLAPLHKKNDPMEKSNFRPVSVLTLRLHYVPGDHGSHGSPKRSAPCDLVNFCLGTQVLLSIITFRHGLSRYPLQTVG